MGGRDCKRKSEIEWGRKEGDVQGEGERERKKSAHCANDDASFAPYNDGIISLFLFLLLLLFVLFGLKICLHFELFFFRSLFPFFSHSSIANCTFFLLFSLLFHFPPPSLFLFLHPDLRNFWCFFFSVFLSLKLIGMKTVGCKIDDTFKVRENKIKMNFAIFLHFFPFPLKILL